MNYNLGRVLPIFRGTYDSATQYTNLDVVYFNGSSYVATGDTVGNTPTDTEHWVPVAMAGTLSPEQVEAIQQEVIAYVQAQGYVIDANYVHTDNNFTNAEKSKLDGIDMSTKQDTLVSGQNIATINGNNLLEGGNIEIQTGGGGGGTTDYTDLTNKPSINGVVLSGNKTTSQLGINIPTKTSDLTNDSGFLTSETEPAFNSSVAKNITNADITNWNSKQAQLQSGVNIMTINNNSILGSGNLEIQTGGGSTPESITVTDTTYTIASLAGNKVYTFSNPLTSLTITAYGDTTLETVLYFTAGTGFTFSVPSDSKYIIEEPVFNDGMSYVVSIQNGTIVMGEIVSQTVSLNSINENNE